VRRFNVIAHKARFDIFSTVPYQPVCRFACSCARICSPHAAQHFFYAARRLRFVWTLHLALRGCLFIYLTIARLARTVTAKLPPSYLSARTLLITGTVSPGSFLETRFLPVLRGTRVGRFAHAFLRRCVYNSYSTFPPIPSALFMPALPCAADFNICSERCAVHLPPFARASCGLRLTGFITAALVRVATLVPGFRHSLGLGLLAAYPACDRRRVCLTFATAWVLHSFMNAPQRRCVAALPPDSTYSNHELRWHVCNINRGRYQVHRQRCLVC